MTEAHDTGRLTARYGSPLYVYDLEPLGTGVGGLLATLPENATLFYSLKANPHPHVVGELRELGCCAEVSSGGELSDALAAGFRPEDCLYTGPGKTDAELRHAVELGVGTYSAESLTDLGRIGAAARQAGVAARCLLRVNATGTRGRGAISMTGRPSQFGFDLDEAETWAGAASAVDGVTVVGLHFFPLSNARDEDALIASFEESIATAAHLRDVHRLPVTVLDLGGGFAAPYARPGERPGYPRLRTALEASLDRHFPADRPSLAFETGRYLAGAAGRLVTTVTDVKRSKGTCYAVLNSGINHLGGMSGLRRMLPLSARPADCDAAEAETEVTLTGPLCAPSDVLGAAVRMPEPRVGDALVIPNVGAYGLSASLIAFLGRACPTEVVVRGGEFVSATQQVITRTTVGAGEEAAAGQTPAPRPAPAGKNPVELAASLVPGLRDGAGEADAEAEFPVESLRALRESGLMGLLVPEEYGGLGGGLRDLVEVSRTLAGGCLSTAMVFAMHCQQADALVRFGTESLRRRVLPRIAAGEVYLASITSERETGGHLLTSASPLEETAQGLRLSRDAPVVTGGAHADAYVVTMRDRPDAAAHEVTLVYVARGEATVEVTGGWNPLGMRATQSLAVQLDAVVTEEQIVGARGEFREVAVESFMPLAHIGWSACWLGAAHQSLRDLVALLRSPRRPGSADLSSDLLQERVARVRHPLELVAAYLDRVTDEVAAARLAGERVDSPAVQVHLNALKVAAAESTFEAADRCVQIAGLGSGYMKNAATPFERTLRDLRSAALNYANDRLLKANGLLTLADSSVRLL
ncbi:acyl-CoA dehydrogenase family protein [Streptomyces sulphureus]|uniref:acyl-CoA dehydrogenase family protein n=1 Tax=Streptomyces sulphureus TaxID=47758 RepID=UPI00036EBA9D|nr:acyl-CoA dehydrogenase family protein [Streptomyces sulphureus]